MALIEINWRPSAKELRNFALVWLVGFSLIGLLVAWKLDAWQTPGWHSGWIPPLVLWAAAVLVGALGLLSPAVVKPVYIVWMGLSFPIGILVSHVVLGVLYFGLFAAFSLVFRLIGRDKLNRRFKPNRDSYWIERPAAVDVRRYFKQF